MNLRQKRKMQVKTKKLINSFKYAGEGIVSSFKSERNMKIHIFIMIMVIIFGFLLEISKLEWIICVMLFSAVISGELFNTAIETIVDMVSPEKNDKAKLAKDVSAGAVLVVALGAAIAGVVIFVPKVVGLVF